MIRFMLVRNVDAGLITTQDGIVGARVGLVITIEDDAPSPPHQDAWDVLESLAGSVQAPSDWSAQHDHYISGRPKR